MNYDIIQHAKSVYDLSESVCKIFRKIGKQKFIESYKKAIDRRDENALSVFVEAMSYVVEKRELTLNLLRWPEYSTITTTDAVAIDVIRRVGRRQPLEADKILKRQDRHAAVWFDCRGGRRGESRAGAARQRRKTVQRAVRPSERDVA
jgi:hypothetical protein